MIFLDPKNDYIFKKIFGQHPDILKSFLNSMLPLPDGRQIVELEYLSLEMIPETFLEKFSAVDVRCKDQYGRQFLVEMQMNWTTAFKQRVLFNASKAFVTQSGKGSEYQQLQPVYALNLINQNFLPQTEAHYHHYAVVHLKNTDERLEGLEFVFIELEKFRAQNIRDKKLQVLWLRFLTEINESTTNIDEELLKQKEIKQAIEYVYEASLSKEEKALYDKNWDRISSEKTILHQTHEKGRAEGRAEGELDKAMVIATKLLSNGMNVNEISEITGLSIFEIEQIKKGSVE